MRFSVAVPLQRIVNGRYEYDLDSFIAECQAAERAGFYSAVVGERRIGVTAYTTSPDVLAAVALANTTRLGFAITVVQLPLRDPVQVIHDATAPNSLFPGRFRLGVGAGYNEHAFELLGAKLTERGRDMERGPEVINAFRNGEISVDVGRGPVPAMGRHRPEVWVGAWAKAGVRRTARLAVRRALPARGRVHADDITSDGLVQSCKDARLDELAALGAAAPTEAARNVVFAEVEKIVLIDKICWVSLFNQVDNFALSNAVRGSGPGSISRSTTSSSHSDNSPTDTTRSPYPPTAALSRPSRVSRLGAVGGPPTGGRAPAGRQAGTAGRRARSRTRSGRRWEGRRRSSGAAPTSRESRRCWRAR